MGLKTSTLVEIVVGMLLLGILLPIGLSGLLNPNNWVVNGTSVFEMSPSGATLQTLILTLLPILIVVSLIMYFVPKAGK